MPGPYNTDLRWRAVFLHYIRRLDYKTIGNQLFMSERSVHRYVKLFHQPGDVIPQKSTGRPRELTGLEEQVILETVLHIPTLFLDELVSEVHQRCGTNPSKTTIFRVLRRYNFSRIKLQQIALQQSMARRAQFIVDVMDVRPENFIFIDETGSDRRDGIRTYGYGVRGMRTSQRVLKVRGSRLNCICAMTINGPLAIKTCADNVNGEKFMEFIREELTQHLSPDSVLILDNAAIHHILEFQRFVDAAGIVLKFLPPYSPDLNPIENLFSKLKSILCRMGDLYMNTADPQQMLKIAFRMVTPDDCRGYLENAGYL